MAIRNKVLLTLGALAFVSSSFIASAQSPHSQEEESRSLDSLLLPGVATAAAVSAIVIASNSASR